METPSDDVSKSSELKQVDHVAELSGQPQMIDEGPKLRVSDATRYLKEAKSRLTSEKYVEFHDILKEYREHSIDIVGVKTKSMKLLEGETELLLGLNIFLPKKLRIVFTQEDEPHDLVMQLVHHIKMGLEDENHLYISFLCILNLYRTGNLSANEVRKKVADLLQDHQDLITEFTNFLPHCYANSISMETMASHAEHGESGSQDHEKAPHKSQVKGKRKRCANVDAGKLNKLGSKRSRVSRKDKNKAKQFQHHDQSCNPSYQLVPTDDPIAEASHRTKMDNQVLNDHWVSVGHSFKPSLKNQYEKILFRLEDDRFELDMSLERIKLAIKQAEELMTRIDDKSIKTNSAFPLERYFQGPSLSCIKTIYGDYGLDIVDDIRKNVSFCLPIVLVRLKQKQKEWIMFRSEFNKMSRKMFVENHQLSLDHHGFYLKKQDEKSLCDTGLLAEINEISKVKSKEEKLHQFPHLDFMYSDIDIQQDFFQLIKLCIAEICSSQQIDKVLKIWTNFVEPMFGVSIDNSNYIAETSQHAAKKGSNNGVKEDEKIMISSELIDTDNYLDFMTNEVDFSPLVNLEKGGFAACMDDRMEVSKQISDHNGHKESVLENEADADNLHVFYGNEAFYIFFRLHHAVYSRLLEAKQSANEKWKGLNDTTPNDSYAIFLDLLHKYLANREKYEYECRTSFVTWSGLIFSIERLINRLSRQLLAIAMDEVDNKLIDLFAFEKQKESGRFVDEAYFENASMIVNGYKIFRFECLPVQETKGQNRLTISQMKFGERNTRA